VNPIAQLYSIQELENFCQGQPISCAFGHRPLTNARSAAYGYKLEGICSAYPSNEWAAFTRQLRPLLESTKQRDQVVIRTDIQNFYGSVDLKRVSGETLRDELSLQEILAHERQLGGLSVDLCGIGSSIVAGVVLQPLDRFLSKNVHGEQRWLRYMDDIFVVCSEANAEETLGGIRLSLAELGLALNEHKTCYQSPGETLHDFGYDIYDDLIAKDLDKLVLKLVSPQSPLGRRTMFEKWLLSTALTMPLPLQLREHLETRIADPLFLCSLNLKQWRKLLGACAKERLKPKALMLGIEKLEARWTYTTACYLTALKSKGGKSVESCILKERLDPQGSVRDLIFRELTWRF
jgi:hypothetical protein